MIPKRFYWTIPPKAFKAGHKKAILVVLLQDYLVSRITMQEAKYALEDNN